MIPTREVKAYYIAHYEIERYVKENYSFPEDYYIVDGESVFEGTTTVIDNISGEFSERESYIKERLKEGEPFELKWILNTMASDGIIPLGTFLVTT